MSTQRINITLPREEMERLKQKPNRSAFVTQAVREKLNAEEKALQERALAEAYRRSSEEDVEMIDEWDRLAGDGI